MSLGNLNYPKAVQTWNFKNIERKAELQADTLKKNNDCRYIFIKNI